MNEEAERAIHLKQKLKIVQDDLDHEQSRSHELERQLNIETLELETYKTEQQKLLSDKKRFEVLSEKLINENRELKEYSPVFLVNIND